MRRDCDECGTGYEAKRSTSKYCKASCRARASARKKSLPDKGTDAPASTGVTDATRKELAAVNREDSALGQAALALAASIDANDETGNALAALTREWRAMLAEAVRGAGRAESGVDQLKAKREQRQHGAA